METDVLISQLTLDVAQQLTTMRKMPTVLSVITELMTITMVKSTLRLTDQEILTVTAQQITKRLKTQFQHVVTDSITTETV